MKQILLSFFLLSSVLTFAQEKRLTPGVKLGLNAPRHLSNPSMQQTVGMVAGLQSEYNIKGNHNLGVEVLYDYAGAKYESANLKAKTGYIDVPIFYKYNVNQGVSFHLGIENSLLIQNKIKNTETEEVNKSLEGIDRYSACGLVGVGYFTPQGFTFDARYNIGINDLLDKKNMRISRFNLTVGWAF